MLSSSINRTTTTTTSI